MDQQSSSRTPQVPQGAEETEIQVYGYQAGSCGYCKCEDCSVSFGIVSERMQVVDYESLMLCGWRRSGTYLYVSHCVYIYIYICACVCVCASISHAHSTDPPPPHTPAGTSHACTPPAAPTTPSACQ